MGALTGRHCVGRCLGGGRYALLRDAENLMQIKLDENLPAVLVNVSAEFGHEADTSPLEGLAGSPDEEIWEAAVRAGQFLITQDLDFSDFRKFVPGTHPGLLLIRPGSPEPNGFGDKSTPDTPNGRHQLVERLPGRGQRT